MSKIETDDDGDGDEDEEGEQRSRGAQGFHDWLFCTSLLLHVVANPQRIWIGSSGSKPAHASVRGRLLDGSVGSDSDRLLPHRDT